jgi:putative phosphoribosyl transferase
MSFRNRRDAGRQLAALLRGSTYYDPVVLALPRGGVPVAYEVADALDAPLEVFVARKVGAPGHEEFGIGAIAEGSGEAVMSDSAAMVGVGPQLFERLAQREQVELDRRIRLYRGALPLPPLEGRDVILVDDGLATGVTAEASLRSIATQRPGRTILAIPVAAPDSVVRLRALADDVVAVLAPEGFTAVGTWYRDFSPTTDAEVIELLTDARSRRRE